MTINQSLPEYQDEERSCRACGCTDGDCSGCIARTGRRCSWTPGDPTLCTACVSRPTVAVIIDSTAAEMAGYGFSRADILRQLIMRANDAGTLALRTTRAGHKRTLIPPADLMVLAQIAVAALEREIPAAALVGPAHVEAVEAWAALCGECVWASPAPRPKRDDAIADRDRHNRIVHEGAR